VLIPYAADIRVALARTAGLEGMGTVEGFDFGAFDALRRPATKNFNKVERRSPAATLFTFDVRSSACMAAREAAVPVVATGGEVNAIVQWITFHLHGDVRYDTGEDASVMAFGIEAHGVAPFEAAPGDAAVIAGSHDRDRLWLWLQET
jgi:hypothetical protein